MGDALKKEKVNAGDVRTLFDDYNYSDLAANVDLNYVSRNFLFGIKPMRYQGQFEIHNLNLPLASLTFRKDSDIHAGTSFSMGEDLKWSLGAQGALLFREESIVEATLVDLASRPQKELVDTQKLSGYFFDLGTSLEFRDAVSISVLGKDFGNWFGGARSHAGRYLFVHDDKAPKVFTSLAWLPYFLGGRFQLGVSSVHFLDRENEASKQLFGTLSYYVGPLRLISGFRGDLFRTGLAMRFSRFEVNVAQEWINKLEESRRAQPRFSVEITSGL